MILKKHYMQKEEWKMGNGLVRNKQDVVMIKLLMVVMNIYILVVVLHQKRIAAIPMTAEALRQVNAQAAHRQFERRWRVLRLCVLCRWRRGRVAVLHRGCIISIPECPLWRPVMCTLIQGIHRPTGR